MPFVPRGDYLVVSLTLAITWPHTFGAVKESFEGAALVHGDVGRLMYVNKMT
jgi:hypothetical protein